MNGFQLKLAERCLSRTREKKKLSRYDEAEIKFLEEVIAEHKMTNGQFQLSEKQNKWLNKLGGRR